MIREIVRKNRSYRRYDQSKKISESELKELIDIGRMTPSGANKQPIRYFLSNTEDVNARIFETLKWAGYLKDWEGPVEGERPAAYIILLAPKNINSAHDEGIIGQTILLAAVEKGMGGCFIANIDRDRLRSNLNISSECDIKLVLALGYPKEKVVMDEISKEDDIKYYRDKNMVHHVPKIKLEDLILNDLHQNNKQSQ